MYVGFLCVQVRYNLAIAGITHRLLIQNDSGSLQEISKAGLPENKHTEILAKVKQGPSKRFYQKLLPFIPAGFNYTEVFFETETFAEYRIVSSPQLAVTNPPQRGPPSIA